MKPYKIIIAFILLCPLTSQAVDDAIKETITNHIEALLPNIEISSIKASPLPDIYQVASGNEYIYISADGQYLIQGDLIDLKNRWNVTEQERAKWRGQTINAINDEELIIFKAKEEKHSIYVFTDIDCGYCRKLHQDITELNNAGITVKYLAYPRSGEYTIAWREMSAVWCAKDKQKAITDAKEGRRDALATDASVDGLVGCNELVKKHFDMGNQIGVKGTPAIFLESGDQIKGYMPPASLLEKIASIKSHAKSL